MKGMELNPGITHSVSGFDKSATQRKVAPRNSMAVRNMLYSPKNTGNCTSIGKQPLTGLTLFFFHSSHCFCENFCGSLLYFSWSALICGARACIRLAERVLAAVS